MKRIDGRLGSGRMSIMPSTHELLKVREIASHSAVLLEMTTIRTGIRRHQLFAVQSDLDAHKSLLIEG